MKQTRKARTEESKLRTSIAVKAAIARKRESQSPARKAYEAKKAKAKLKKKKRKPMTAAHKKKLSLAVRAFYAKKKSEP